MEVDVFAIDEDGNTAGYCLSLPGKTLYLTPLLPMKKFCKRGHIRQLEPFIGWEKVLGKFLKWLAQRAIWL